MVDQPDNVVLAILHKIDQRIERVADDMHDLKMREGQVDVSIAGINRRLDRVDARMDRIERRLDLVELPH
jgi:archaellum component FlaC